MFWRYYILRKRPGTNVSHIGTPDKTGGRIWDTGEMIKAGWMDENGNWKTHNGSPPICMDKAGGYGVQTPEGRALIGHIDGDYYNVVGLPIKKLAEILKDKFGIEKIELPE